MKILQNYSLHESGLFINKDKNFEGIKQEFRNIDIAIFDLDGTLYPNFMIVDLAKKIFTKYACEGSQKYSKKLDVLTSLIKNRDKLDFRTASEQFISLLKDEKCSEFVDELSILFHDIYPLSRNFISSLISREVGCHMISLTADFIANNLKNVLKFESVESMSYEAKQGYFTGQFVESVTNPQDFKFKALEKLLSVSDFKNVLVVGNDVDDLKMYHTSTLSAAVNPTATLLNKYLPDLLLITENSDPWANMTLL